jgi:hypothetical protein
VLSSTHESVAEVDAVASQRVELRGLQPALRLHESEGVVSVVVRENEDNVARLGTGDPAQPGIRNLALCFPSGGGPGQGAHKSAAFDHCCAPRVDARGARRESDRLRASWRI